VEKLKSYKDLIVWQKAYQLVLLMYKITMNFPKAEIYGLTSQMRRSAISIPSNIAEGYCRQYTGEYLQFLSIAYGSCGELETQILLAKDIEFLDENNFCIAYNLCQEISKMLNSLISSIKKRKNI
jgi:four helix bundle protein